MIDFVDFLLKQLVHIDCHQLSKGITIVEPKKDVLSCGTDRWAHSYSMYGGLG